MCWNREYVAARAQFKVAVHSEIPVVVFPSLAMWVRESYGSWEERENLGDANMKKLSMPPNLVTKI